MHHQCRTFQITSWRRSLNMWGWIIIDACASWSQVARTIKKCGISQRRNNSRKSAKKSKYPSLKRAQPKMRTLRLSSMTCSSTKRRISHKSPSKRRSPIYRTVATWMFTAPFETEAPTWIRNSLLLRSTGDYRARISVICAKMKRASSIQITIL